jgi:hypothetical protein
MGAINDRYRIATNNKLHVQLAVQNLLNFEWKTTGGDCDGGDSEKVRSPGSRFYSFRTQCPLLYSFPLCSVLLSILLSTPLYSALHSTKFFCICFAFAVYE